MENDEELMRQAKKRAHEKVGFYTHLSVYILVNLFLVAVWWFTGAGFPWFIFVLLAWGIGIAAHGIGTFGRTGMTDKMVEREYQKLKQRGKE
jgi:hypothetical protein